MTAIYVLLGLTLLGVCVIAYQQFRSQTDGDPRLKAEIEKKNQEIGECKNQIAEMKSEMDDLKGQGKVMYDRYKSLESDHKATLKERDGFSARVAKFETAEAQRQQRHEDMATKLEEAKVALEDERTRIRREDEERLQQEKEDRDRMWAEHENHVVSLLTDLCNQPQCKFQSYDNNNLPEDMHGSLKPDFMIDFLEQYVIFDAKISEAKNLQIYINDQVKKTAKKVQGNEKIYSTIFLVVPTIAIDELKTTYFYEDGFTFFVVDPASLASILSMFKKVESYEFAEAMDPQERENIVDLVAAFHFHISARNAHELGLMLHGLETLDKAERTMDPKILADALVKKAKMRHLNLNTADTKQLVANPEGVAQQLLELVEPKAKISKEELQNS